MADKIKLVKIKIAKVPNDTATKKFISYNGVGYELKVGEELEIPEEVYESSLKHSYLADRVSVLGTRNQ